MNKEYQPMLAARADMVEPPGHTLRQPDRLSKLSCKRSKGTEGCDGRRPHQRCLVGPTLGPVRILDALACAVKSAATDRPRGRGPPPRLPALSSRRAPVWPARQRAAALRFARTRRRQVWASTPSPCAILEGIRFLPSESLLQQWQPPRQAAASKSTTFWIAASAR
jgi:hypothetical protein